MNGKLIITFSVIHGLERLYSSKLVVVEIQLFEDLDNELLDGQMEFQKKARTSPFYKR